MVRRLILLLMMAAAPAFPQYTSAVTKELLLGPWLKGKPEGSEFMLSANLQRDMIGDYALLCAVEFETERGKFAEAQQLLVEAAKLSPPALMLEAREAKLRAAMGDFVGARKSALASQPWDGSDVRKLNLNHPLMLNALGEAYAARGQHELALAILERSAKQARNAAPEWTEARTLMAYSRLAQNDLVGALEDARAALSTAQKKWGDDGPRTLDAQDAVGAIEMARGNFKEADRLFGTAFMARKRLYKRPHPKMAASYLHAARSAALQKDSVKALELIEKGLALLNQALPKDNGRTGMALAESSEIYAMAGKQVESRAMLDAAVRMLTESLGEDASRVQELKARLSAGK